MAKKEPKKDINQLAKSIVDRATSSLDPKPAPKKPAKKAKVKKA